MMIQAREISERGFEISWSSKVLDLESICSKLYVWESSLSLSLSLSPADSLSLAIQNPRFRVLYQPRNSPTRISFPWHPIPGAFVCRPNAIRRLSSRDLICTSGSKKWTVRMIPERNSPVRSVPRILILWDCAAISMMCIPSRRRMGYAQFVQQGWG